MDFHALSVEEVKQIHGGDGWNMNDMIINEELVERLGKQQQPPQRKYLPTFSDLVDRLTISQQKAIFIPEKRDEYVHEMELILHDLDLIIQEEKVHLNAEAVRAIIVIMLTNRIIWENERKARQGGNEQDRLL